MNESMHSLACAKCVCNRMSQASCIHCNRKRKVAQNPKLPFFFCVFCFLVACVLMEAKEGEEHGHRAQAFVKAFNQALAKTLETAR